MSSLASRGLSPRRLWRYPAPVRDGMVHLDPAARQVTVGGRQAVLNRREYAVLAALYEADGAVVPHAVLIERAWGPHTPLANLRVAILHLRRKLESDPELPSLILAEPGLGYRLGGGR